MHKMPKEVLPLKILPSLKNTQVVENIDNYFDFSVLIRMLFSCLKDADILDTDKFLHPESIYIFSPKNNTRTFAKIGASFEEYFQTRYRS